MGSYLLMSLLAATVGLLDMRVLPYLQSSGANSNGLVDVVVALTTGILGLRLASENGFPGWWQKWPQLFHRRRLLLLGFLILFVVILTTSLYFISSLTQLPGWARSLSPELAILLALRAALGEELLFRFFIFSFIVWIGGKFRVERAVSLIAGAILSSIAFTLIHPGFYIPFLEGLALTWIYLEGAIVPAIATHFCADAIPFLILSMK